MSYSSKRGLGKKYTAAIVVSLVLAIILGVALDLIITKIEYAVYRKPNEYSEFVEKYSQKYDVPEHVIWSVIKAESSFESAARSSAGAVGLMQMTEPTFSELTEGHLKENLQFSALYDPETSIRYGTYYLSYLYRMYGDWLLVFAAYNAGPGNVSEWLSDSAYSSDGKALDSIPYKETRNYVSRVDRNIRAYDRLYK